MKKPRSISSTFLLFFLLSKSTTGFVLKHPASSRSGSRTLLFAGKKSDNKNSNVDPAKKAALDGVLNQIERNYGRGSVVRLGDAENMNVDCISSGALTLDAALGGGFPKGRVVEIYGPESSGKTTLALHAIAESQKQGGTAAFVDAEHALDPSYGKSNIFFFDAFCCLLLKKEWHFQPVFFFSSCFFGS